MIQNKFKTFILLLAYNVISSIFTHKFRD